MHQTGWLLLPVLPLLGTSGPPAVADGFSFGPAVSSLGQGYADHDDIDADIESLRAEILRTDEGWQLVVDHEAEVEDVPVGYCDLVLDVLDRDYPAPAIRVTVRLDRPVGFDDEEVLYSARTVVRIADEHIRDPRRLRLHAVIVPAGGGPVLDRDSVSVRFRR